MAKRPTIGLIGAGNLAAGLARALKKAGYPVGEIVTRDIASSRKKGDLLARQVRARCVTLSNSRLDADVLVIAVPDDSIARCADQIANHGFAARIVLHCSGALSSDELQPLARMGASIGSMHPLMSFVGDDPDLNGVLFSVEGMPAAVAAARQIARALGGIPQRIESGDKALYHAFGAFTSPLLVAHLSGAEHLAEIAGISRAQARRAMRPIVRRTLNNYFDKGGAAAFSGPLVRGDVETIRHHLQALAAYPVLQRHYIVLVEQALEALPVGRRKDLARLLKQPSRNKFTK